MVSKSTNETLFLVFGHIRTQLLFRNSDLNEGINAL